MKSIQISRYLFFLFLFWGSFAAACPACERNQPKLLKGITHGTGPQNQWDYIIVSIMALIVLFSFVMLIRYVFFVKEPAGHIKNKILSHGTHL